MHNYRSNSVATQWQSKLLIKTIFVFLLTKDVTIQKTVFDKWSHTNGEQTKYSSNSLSQKDTATFMILSEITIFTIFNIWFDNMFLRIALPKNIYIKVGRGRGKGSDRWMAEGYVETNFKLRWPVLAANLLWAMCPPFGFLQAFKFMYCVAWQWNLGHMVLSGSTK